ncbi:retrograde regulation protein 2 [Neonectria punicea]|uniref:Retrograde regulation protein 2 n=1 Tax=Neonectria punicea TaxID=979145 RepID=A0ABR1HVA7_9HYPO
MAAIVELDNYKETLTPWDPGAKSQLYAIVDMGSNGIRFSITSLAAPTTRLLLPVYADRAAISLYDVLLQNNNVFPPETITLVTTTLNKFKAISVDYGVPDDQFLILATQAMRTADNGGDLAEALKRGTKENPKGLTVSVLRGAVETLCGAVMGVRSGLVNVDGGALFMDLGGGSVQMTWVDTKQEDYAVAGANAGVSMEFGAARLIEILSQPEEVRTQALDELDSKMQKAYAALCDQFPVLNAIKTAYENGDKHSKVKVYMCGGGFRGYGSMLMYNDKTSPYPIPSANGYTAPGKLFKDTEKMLRVNKEEKDRIFGLSKRRRQQFPAIVAVIDSFIKTVPNIKDVTFSAGSNRQGALMMKLPEDIRESNPLDVLGTVSAEERPILEAVSQLIQDALPTSVDFSDTPTVFTAGLGPLFVRDIWGRAGYDSDTNSSYALNHAIIRDPEAPGLTHVGRALLALTASARWGGNLGSMDAKVFKGLSSIVENKSKDSPAWAGYIGAVADVIANVLPSFPKSVDQVKKAISITSSYKEAVDKDKLILTIEVTSNDHTKGINLGELVELLEGVAKKSGGEKPSFKVSAKINLRS